MRRLNLAWLNSTRKVIRFKGVDDNADDEKNQFQENESAGVSKEETKTSEASGCQSELRHEAPSDGTGLPARKVDENGSEKHSDQLVEQTVEQDPTWTKIQKAIRYHRVVLNATQKECADAAGISQKCWSDYEHNTHPNPPTSRQIKTIEKIADLFGLHYSDMLNDYQYVVEGRAYNDNKSLIIKHKKKR